MKYLIPVYMRVGSTLLQNAIEQLSCELGDYLPLDKTESDEELQEKIDSCEKRIIKTHDRAAVDCLGLRGVHIFYSRRNLPDTFVSRFLFEKNYRRAKGLPLQPALAKILDQYPDIPDSAFCNFVVETQEKWLEKEARMWRRFTHNVSAENVTVVNYDKIADEPEKLVAQLRQVIPCTDEVAEKAVGHLQFSKMKASHDKHFIRAGRVNDSANLLDPSMLENLRALEESVSTKRLNEL